MGNDEVRFLSKGNFIDKKEALRRPIMVVGSILPDEKLAQTFDSSEELYRWVDHSKDAEKVHEIEKTAALLRTRQHDDHSRAQQRVKASVDRVTRELSELAARLQLDPREAGYELFLKATVQRDILEPPIFDPAIFFQDPGLKGNWLPQMTLLHYPDYRWFDWNDKASSILVYGVAILWEHIWFQGSQLILWGAPFIPFAYDLSWFGWNDRVSSSIVG